jgi:hypothetical protein
LNQRILNSVYSSQRMKRRYEVWFLRCGLADGGGAWWFRYLLLNRGRGGCGADPTDLPVQVWATWFPRAAAPRTFIQGYPAEALELSGPAQLPFHWHAAENGIEENTCWGDMRVDGHPISWKLRYASDFGAVLAERGWLGFSKSPHSNAVFSGEITFDGNRFAGAPLGFGVQGHNCGYRYRTYWRWMHAYFRDASGRASTLEVLAYDMPFGLVFRNAVWWHEATPITLRGIKETEIVNDSSKLRWIFSGLAPDGSPVEAAVEGTAPEVHHLPYTKTDCSGTFQVANASLARAQVRFGKNGGDLLETATGAVLEMRGT